MYLIHSAALVGLEPYLVTVEVDLLNQLPAFSLVGLASSMTQESRERVRSAVINSSFTWPARKIVVNLVPASLPKWGSHFELAMAVGILAVSAKLEKKKIFAFGELSLDGEIRPCGWLAMIEPWLKENSSDAIVILHPEDAAGLSDREFVENHVHSARTLREALSGFEKKLEIRAKPLNPVGKSSEEDFALLRKVQNEPLAVAAAVVTLAGRHHTIFAGPHGSGKSMLIQAILRASPQLRDFEFKRRNALLKGFGEKLGNSEQGNSRPVAVLQASISRAALEGALLSSGEVLPGELTRAHFGALVADEFLEFRRDVIEALRQPLEEKVVRLQRAKFRAVLPADFQLLASTNLCPCGAFGRSLNSCRCLRVRKTAYQLRLSGPILDRFDMAIAVGVSANIPRDLLGQVQKISDPAFFIPCLKKRYRAEQKKINPEGVIEIEKSVARFFGEQGLPYAPASFEMTERGKNRVARVARTIASLLDEDLDLSHFRLACIFRVGISKVLISEENPAGYQLKIKQIQ